MIVGSLLPPGCGCEQIAPVQKVKQWIVTFSTETGTWVNGRAATFAGAIRSAWGAVFPEVVANVAVDPSNPLKGSYRGRIQITTIKPGGLTITVQFENPSMIRSSADSDDWEIDPETYPENLRIFLK